MTPKATAFGSKWTSWRNELDLQHRRHSRRHWVLSLMEGKSLAPNEERDQKDQPTAVNKPKGYIRLPCSICGARPGEPCRPGCFVDIQKRELGHLVRIHVSSSMAARWPGDHMITKTVRRVHVLHHYRLQSRENHRTTGQREGNDQACRAYRCA